MPIPITAVLQRPDTPDTPVPAANDAAPHTWAWLTNTTTTVTATAVLAAVISGLAVYLLMRRPGRADISRHLMYAPLLLVNAAAVYGQIAFFYEKVAPGVWPIPGKLALAVLIAAAIESIAIYVGWHAHDALLNKASATAARLRRRSYLLAGIVGLINYWHFAGEHFRPTAASAAFGLLSLLSPWLWGLHTRRAQHVQLTKEGSLDEAGVTFSAERMRMYPFRTYMARRWSVDNYVRDPKVAWEGYKAHRAQQVSDPLTGRVRRAWLVLAGQQPAVVSGHGDRTRADVATGQLSVEAPDMAAVIAPDTKPDTAPDMSALDAPDIDRTPVPDSDPTHVPDTAPDTQDDTAPGTEPDITPDTQTDTTPPTGPDTDPTPDRTTTRVRRRTPDRTPKWTKDQLKAFKLRDTRADMTYPMIAREIGVSEKTVSRWFQRRDEADKASETATDAPDIPFIHAPFELRQPAAAPAVNGSPYPNQET